MLFRITRRCIAFLNRNGADGKILSIIFSLSTFPRVIYNTLFIAIMKIVAGIIVPVTVALLLNEVRNIVYKRTLQTIVYLPHFISWVA